MNLDSAPTGQPVTLDRPELTTAKARRLAELGLRGGATVTPLHRTAGGGRVIGVGATRVAVARAVLSRLALRRPSDDVVVDVDVDVVDEDAGALAGVGCGAGGGMCHAPAGGDRGGHRGRAGATPPTAKGCHADGGGVLPAGAPVVALVGTPNVGKSTLFNALTGARRRVGNWPGTTVGVGQGTWQVAGSGRGRQGDGGGRQGDWRGGGRGGRGWQGDGRLALVDLPGTYSLDPVSPDEELTRRLLVDGPAAERPDCVVLTVSAADPARGLYLLSQVLEQGLRVVVALSMGDVAARQGVAVSTQALARAVGVPVVALDPRRRSGVEALAPEVLAALAGERPRALRHRVDGADELALADARFTWVATAVEAAVHGPAGPALTWSDRIDRVVTSPVVGPLLFLAVMWGVFQATTVGAAPLVDWLDRLFAGPVSDGAVRALGAVGLADTWVRGLVVDGLVAGVGMVLTFVPLMTIMFVLLALLEDSGYLARAAVVADRLMRAVGLPGRAFVPLVIGFGCNVPAVSATRVLPDARHRLLTALVVPFTTCSARLPVYVLVAAAMFGQDAGTVVFGMYVASVALVVLGALLLRATVLRGVRQEPLVLDLPGYQLPMPRMLAVATWSKLAAFLRTATGIIVVTVAAVWLLSAVPARPGVGGFGAVAVEDSAFGAVSKVVAPVFAPAGFGDWHTAGALVVGFVAKEAVVSSWAQTYAAGEPENLHRPGRLGTAVRADFEHSSGGHAGLAGLAFMLFVLGYAPCVATMTAQVREIGRRWTLIGVAMSLSVSWLVAVVVFQVGRVFL